MQLFNEGWEFSKQPLNTTFEEMKQREASFAPVGIPHDWLIAQTQNLYEEGTGWYRKKFFAVKEEKKKVFLRFDGVYMDSAVYVNEQKVCEWKYGYSAFEAEITDELVNGENEIRVSVNFQVPNSRWYSGAGIFRNVWLKTVNETYIVSDGVYFHEEQGEDSCRKVEIETEVRGTGAVLSYALREKGTAQWKPLLGEESPFEEKRVFKTVVKDVKIWDVEHPNVYELRVTLQKDGEILQSEIQNVGFRSIEFSPQEGFLLNGRKLKLNGVCEHHDLGCLGAAYHNGAMRRKFALLKEMGVNAVRTAHNMPAAELMALADEMGVLIVSEAFDIWESPKNPYDYARFFPDWYEKDVASWVKRDRNHPSLILWSIGNEIYDTHISTKGQTWTKILMEEVRKHDAKKNAQITLGSNYMPWENAQNCADIVKIAGYNYGEKYYREHHEKHPDWVIYGSETGSIVQSRGIYHFPYQQSVLADEDEQCSSLGNSTTSWGAKSTEACILAEREHPFSCGQFLWSGFDYIGEPTPYHTRNSYFGQLDTAGFPKDSYYIYQAAWTDYKKKPMVHIFPYWDFNDGQFIDLRVCSNAPMIELFFNGKSQGIFEPEYKDRTELVGHWQLPYKAGEIRAAAYDEDGKVIAQDVRHSFGEAAQICFRTERESMLADGEDLFFTEIYMRDKDGYPVENANNRVHISVEGAGMLAGTDNGDSTDTDGYKDYSRRLFSGKLLVVCRAGDAAGEMKITVRSQGMKEAVLLVPVLAAKVRKGVSPLAYLAGEDTKKKDETELPVRNIRMVSSNGLHLYQDKPETEVTAILCPADASDREVLWSVVDDAGIPLKIAEIEPHGLKVRVRAKSDGQFRLRCMSKCGTDKVRIISQLEFIVSGLGTALTNPYEFVSAGLYDYGKGAIGNGNEHGVATARDGESQVGFWELNFGPYGSDEITVPIFALTDEPHRIKIYEGMPDKGGELLADVVYQRPKIWNVYQEAVYKLKKRLCGVTGICFVTEQKMHIKGFLFKEYNRAWQQIKASECDRIYGDSYALKGEVIENIGNNVTIEFDAMQFGENGAHKITVCGATPLKKNTIILRFVTEGREEWEERRKLEFAKGEEIQEFSFEPVYGTKKAQFIFLPGSSFDFKWFRFE